MSEENPIACSLSDQAFRRREATILFQFKSAVITTEELENGYGFRLPGDSASLAIVADLIQAERECCPFLTFELRAEPKMGPLMVRVSGPAPSKQFLKSILL
jgi:hypothetical protein